MAESTEFLMSRSHAHHHPLFGKPILLQALRCLLYGAAGILAVYELSVGQVTLIALALVAGLAFLGRLDAVSRHADTGSFATPLERADGGSFPGTEPTRQRSARPAVLDGGSLEHRLPGSGPTKSTNDASIHR
jgi:hypothetical protein